MQASVARHEKLFFVHVNLPQIDIEKDVFATSNSTKHVIYESVRAHIQYSKTIKRQSHNAEKYKLFRK